MRKIKKLKFTDLPEHKKFLWLVANNVTSIDILFLAEQDHGRDIDKHAELITHFKQTLDTSKLQSWHPMEVWELNRWSSPGYLDIIGHARRAFSCTGIWAYYSDDIGNSFDEALDVLLPLFESLVRLDLEDWQKHFSNFLSHSLKTIKDPEDRFTVQLTQYLLIVSQTDELNALRTGYNQLMADEMSMLKHDWESQWNETWDPVLEPEIERPAEIVDTYIIHGTAYMFAAKYVYQKAEEVKDATLSKDLKTLARRIAWLKKSDIHEFLPASTIYL